VTAGRAKAQMRILHFSDPHVQLRDWRRRPLRELGPLRALATVELWKGRGARYDGAEGRLRALGKLGLEFEHAVCTGDLTQLGMDEEMRLAREALEPLASSDRFTALAGNHDRFPLDARPVHFFEAHFPEQVRSDLPQFAPLRIRLLGGAGGAALIAIDSAVPYSWPLLARGRIDEHALTELALALGHPEVRSRCALVLTHHAPLRKNGKADWPHHYLQNATDFLQVVRAGDATILAGHVHERYDLPETDERPRLLCVGSSTDVKHPGAYAITIEDAKIVGVQTIATT
jgi:3',5'-cyclic AMP phosphodiesterase CpdA